MAVVRAFRLTLLAIMVSVLVAACGSGATQGPESGDQGHKASASSAGAGNPAPGGRTGGGAPGGGNGAYGWLPPEGDPSVQATLGTALNYLHAGDCDGAAAYLDQGQPPAWQNFTSPRNVLLFEAGIELCRGNTRAAAMWFARADALGWAGSDDKNTCALYQAVGSAVQQRAPGSVRCQGGQPPPYVSTDGTVDDPRTPANEASASPSESGSPSGSPSGVPSPEENGPSSGQAPPGGPPTGGNGGAPQSPGDG